jgi:hypothetical protein
LIHAARGPDREYFPAREQVSVAVLAKNPAQQI